MMRGYYFGSLSSGRSDITYPKCQPEAIAELLLHSTRECCKRFCWTHHLKKTKADPLLKSSLSADCTETKLKEKKL